MPVEKRHALWALGAFKNTIESIPLSVTEPTLGFMRLAWWRDQILLLETGQISKGQPVLSALKQYQHACKSGKLVDFINEHETLIENPDKEIISKAYPEILENILGRDFARYKKLENKLTVILKRHHGTRWERSPPFLALRLWGVNFLT